MSTQIEHISHKLHQYILDHSVKEHPVLQELREMAVADPDLPSQMLTAPEIGQFLQFFIHLSSAKTVLELGTFVGYSTLAMALALPPQGEIVTCDINEPWTSMAKQYCRKAGVESKITWQLKQALELFPDLEKNKFDLAFIDADKSNYVAYYEKTLDCLRPGGLMVVDNALWGGSVSDLSIMDPSTEAIRAVNARAYADPRVEMNLLPLGDGVLLVRKI